MKNFASLLVCILLAGCSPTEESHEREGVYVPDAELQKRIAELDKQK